MKTLQHIQPRDLEFIHGINLLVTIDQNGQKVTEWAKENAQDIERLLQANGALLIRGLKILSSKQFSIVLSTLFGEDLQGYTYRSTPRTALRGNVYTATEYHPHLTIAQHNETAYSNRWAMRIGFLSMVVAEQGGETPIGDSRLLYQRIPVAIRDKFEQKKIMYVRNYSDIDLPWSEVFQTEDKAEVEQFCRENHLQFEWLENNGLRTRQINPASAVHPISGEKVWFNQAHLFHVSSLDKETSTNLLNIMGEENLPRNTYYGDGSPIELEALQIIRDLYQETKIVFQWQKNDLMLLDNMLYTHGREPFTGHRKVLVGMSRIYGHDM